MKQLKPQVINKLSQQYGLEPIIVFAIHFVDATIINNLSGANVYTNSDINQLITLMKNGSSAAIYADKTIYDSTGNVLIPGKILNIPTINSILNFDGNSTSSQLDIEIEDTDQTILNLLGQVNIQKVPAFIYIYFDGIALSDMPLIFEGEIVSGFSWSDKTQTAKFAVVNHIEEREVGFSPEQGYIKDLPLDLIGKPWPFGYGSVIKYPAIQINYAPTCITTIPMSWADLSLDTELARLETILSLYLGIALLYFIGALQAYFSEDRDLGDQLTDLGNQSIAIYQQVLYDQQGKRSIRFEQQNIGRNPQTVISNVPKSLSGLFSVGGQVANGRLNPVKDIHVAGGSGVATLSLARPLPIVGESLLINYSPVAKQGYIYIPAGSSVRFLGNYPLVSVINCLGGRITGVYAYRQTEGAHALVSVAKNLWKSITIKAIPDGVVTTTPNFKALGILLHKPLSSLFLQQWDDQLYVSYVSNVGPSIKSIFRFLIATYTVYTYDRASMNSLPNFQINFATTDQKDVMVQIKEICFQCNIAVWLTEGKFFFKFLPIQSSSVMSLSLDDIIKDTMEIGISPTENIVTKIHGAWQYNYQYDTKNFIQYRYNDFRYGVHRLDVDYYCFQDPEQIVQSMLFWLYRKGNTWKRLKFSVPLKFIQLELFDNIHINIDVVDKYVLGKTAFDAQVVGIDLNPDTWLVDLELELPIYVGSKINSPAYWLGNYNGQFFAIDDFYGLTEKPKQTLAYQRGLQIAIGISAQRLQFQINDLANQHQSIPMIGVNQPDSVSGTPANSQFSIFDGVAQVIAGYTGNAIQIPPQSNQPAIQYQAKPGFDYNYATYPGLQSTQEAQPGGGIPGTIDKHASGMVYSCTIYPKGLDKPGTVIEATLLQDAVNDIDIPPETWTFFSKLGTKKNSEGNTVDNYLFQVPLWLG